MAKVLQNGAFVDHGLKIVQPQPVRIKQEVKEMQQLDYVTCFESECVQEIQSIFSGPRILSSDSWLASPPQDRKLEKFDSNKESELSSSWMTFSPPSRALNPIIMDAKFVETESLGDNFQIFGMTPPQRANFGSDRWPHAFVDKVQ